MAGSQMQPIFKPLRAKLQPLGLPMNRAFQILCVAFVGALLAIALGAWEHEVPVAYTEPERQIIYSDLRNVAMQMASIEQQRVVEGAISYDDMALSTTQAEILKTARELGITAKTTDAELEALVPEEHVTSRDVVPTPWRFAVLVGLPLAAGFTLFFEGNSRTSVHKELVRARRYRSSQKAYRCSPRDYVERACGVPYWEAVANPERGR